MVARRGAARAPAEAAGWTRAGGVVPEGADASHDLALVFPLVDGVARAVPHVGAAFPCAFQVIRVRGLIRPDAVRAAFAAIESPALRRALEEAPY